MSNTPYRHTTELLEVPLVVFVVFQLDVDDPIDARTYLGHVDDLVTYLEAVPIWTIEELRVAVTQSNKRWHTVVVPGNALHQSSSSSGTRIGLPTKAPLCQHSPRLCRIRILRSLLTRLECGHCGIPFLVCHVSLRASLQGHFPSSPISYTPLRVVPECPDQYDDHGNTDNKKPDRHITYHSSSYFGCEFRRRAAPDR